MVGKKGDVMEKRWWLGCEKVVKKNKKQKFESRANRYTVLLK